MTATPTKYVSTLHAIIGMAVVLVGAGIAWGLTSGDIRSNTKATEVNAGKLEALEKYIKNDLSASTAKIDSVLSSVNDIKITLAVTQRDVQYIKDEFGARMVKLENWRDGPREPK